MAENMNMNLHGANGSSQNSRPSTVNTSHQTYAKHLQKPPRQSSSQKNLQEYYTKLEQELALARTSPLKEDLAASSAVKQINELQMAQTNMNRAKLENQQVEAKLQPEF